MRALYAHNAQWLASNVCVYIGLGSHDSLSHFAISFSRSKLGSSGSVITAGTRDQSRERVGGTSKRRKGSYPSLRNAPDITRKLTTALATLLLLLPCLLGLRN